MQINNFRITNFRSINDSGVVDVNEETLIVGRNESGKTSLLLALCSLNPVDGMQPLSYIKDFPRDRSETEFTDSLRVVQSTWRLSVAEKAQLTALFPRAAHCVQVTVGRTYKSTRFIGFVDLPELALESVLLQRYFRKIEQHSRVLLNHSDAYLQTICNNALNEFKSRLLSVHANLQTYAQQIVQACQQYTDVLIANQMTLSDPLDEALMAIETYANGVNTDADAHKKALLWIIEKLPVFVYLDEFPNIDGHQNLIDYRHHDSEHCLNEHDKNFAKMMQVAGIDVLALDKLLDQPERRQQMVNRGGATLTKKLQALWTDRALKIRFNIDGHHFDTLLSDSSAIYDVEVNLNERSRGFKWFFSFFITFSDTKAKTDKQQILLLDEPGLHLHAHAQSELLAYFRQLENQIIFSTHSPFMVPTTSFDGVRTMNISEAEGSVVSNHPKGNARTLFPLHSALGYQLREQILTDNHYILVDSLADYWLLAPIFSHLMSETLFGEYQFIPAGALQHVAMLTTFVESQNKNIIVLSKSNPSHPQFVDQGVVYIGDLLGGTELSIEDLLGKKSYGVLVKAAYKTALKSRLPILDKSISSVLACYQAALLKKSIIFDRHRVARVALTMIATQPELLLQDENSALFKTVIERIQQSSL